MRSTTLIPILTVALLAACGSTTRVSKPINSEMSDAVEPRSYRVENIDSQGANVPAQFVAGIREHLVAELRRQDLLGSDDSSTHEVRVKIVDYRMRGNVTRFMFGILAGRDGVKSKITVVDRDSGQLVGESSVSTFNVTAVAGPQLVAEMHGRKIAEFLAVGPEQP